jgi:Rrf2 family iron-sulfur cluster assembly transcriptional regulator
MKLTTRGHYGVKAMLDLCCQPVGVAASVHSISQRQNIPAPYLEKLLIELRRADLVRSRRGIQGGYWLARSPRTISLGQILRALGESIPPLPRQTPNADCPEDWVAFSLWRRLSAKLQSALDEIALEDLYFDARSWQAARGQDSNFTI